MPRPNARNPATSWSTQGTRRSSENSLGSLVLNENLSPLLSPGEGVEGKMGDEPWRNDMSDTRAKLVSVVKSRGKGAPVDAREAATWIARRREEKSLGMIDGQRVQTSVPCFGMDTFKEREMVETSTTPSAVERLAHRPFNVLPWWKSDPIKVLGNQQKVDEEFRRQLEEQSESEADYLTEHSRNQFATKNDQYRFVKELRLKERLFIFYMRRCRDMIKDVEAIAEYWEGTEDKLDDILFAKYGGFNLTTEKLTRHEMDQVDMARLIKDMAKHKIKMSEGYKPIEHWIPQHERRTAPIALRDTLLLSEALVSRPHTAWDINVQDQFVKADSLASRPFPPPAIVSKADDDEEQAPKDVEMWRVSLSLKEQVIGMTRPVTSDSQMASPAASSPRYLPSLTGAAGRPFSAADSDLMSSMTTPLQSGAATRASTPGPASAMKGRGVGGGGLGMLPPPQTPPLSSPGAGGTVAGVGEHGSDASMLSSPAGQSDGAGRTTGRPDAEWKMRISETHDQVYWYNTVTGESRWTRPKVKAVAKEEGETGEDQDMLSRLMSQADSVDVSRLSSSSALSRLRSAAGSIGRMASVASAWSRMHSVADNHASESMPGYQEEGEARIEFDAEKYHGEYRVMHSKLEEESGGVISSSQMMRTLRQGGISMADSKRILQWAGGEGKSGWDKVRGNLGRLSSNAMGRTPSNGSMLMRMSSQASFGRMPSHASSFGRSSSIRSDVSARDSPDAITWHGICIVMTMIEWAGEGHPIPEELPGQLRDPPPKPVALDKKGKGMIVSRKRNLDATRHWALGHEDGIQRRIVRPPLTLEEAAIQRIEGLAKGFSVRYKMKKRKIIIARVIRIVKASQIQWWWRRKLAARAPKKQEGGKVDSFGPMHFRVMFRIRVFCRGWLKRARNRILLEEQSKAALIIQRKYRGMIGMRKLRRMRITMLEEACVIVQRAWRKRLEWIKIVRKEEARVKKEAKRLANAYLFGGKTSKEAREMKNASLEEFEKNTTELGRDRRRQSLYANAAGQEASGPGGFRKSRQALQASWLTTLKMMIQKEEESGEAGASAGGAGQGGGGDGGEGGEGHGVGAGETGGQTSSPPEKKAQRQQPKNISTLFGFTELKNSDKVEASIAEQRAGAAKSLHLVGMQLVRWPFGVTDKNTGRPLWLWLSSVWLSNNELKGLPMDFYMLTGLTDLRLNNNHLSGLPPQVGSMTNMVTLWLHENQISHMPPELCSLDKMTHMTLNNNRLESLPFDWFRLTSLKQVSLHTNPLMSPPMALAEKAMKPEGVDNLLVYLLRFYESKIEPHVLFLEDFKLEAIPPDFSRIIGCKDVVLRKNRLSYLEEEVFWDDKYKMPFHPYLTRLDVSHNQLTELPDVLTRLLSLNTINVSDNQISRLPMTLVNLTNLTDLKAKNNPLTFPPMEVIEHGVEVYLLGGSKHHDRRMGMYFKSTDVHCGRAIYRKREGDDDNLETLTSYTPTVSMPISRRGSMSASRRSSGSPSRRSSVAVSRRKSLFGGRSTLSRQNSGSDMSGPGSVPRSESGKILSRPGSGSVGASSVLPRQNSGGVGEGGSVMSRQGSSLSGGLRSPPSRPASVMGNAASRPASAMSSGIKRRDSNTNVMFSDVVDEAPAAALPQLSPIAGSPVQKARSGGGYFDGGSNSTSSVASPLNSRPSTAPSASSSTRRIISSSQQQGALQMSDLEHKSGTDIDVDEFTRALEARLEKKHRYLLYFSTECDPPSWCVGPDTNPAHCWLRAMDSCAVPSEISTEWIETPNSSDLHVRGDRVFLQGVGVFEFCWRKLKYTSLKSKLKQQKKDMKANEDIWRRQGDIQKLIQVQKANKKAFDEASGELQQRFQDMALQTLPKDCVDVNAKIMNLENNMLRRYPEELCGMTRLVELNISNNLVRSLPSGVHRLRSLTTLNVSCNDIVDLPASIAAVESLKELNVARNKLSVAPAPIEALTNLTLLNFDHNFIVCIPLSYSSLVRLNDFKLGMNVIETVSSDGGIMKSAFQGLKGLKALDVNSNRLQNLSPAIKSLEHMETLDISRNFFETLESISDCAIHWKCLTKIIASECSISSIPDSFRHIKALTSIDLSANSLTSIDLCLFDLPDLQSINLNVNFIKSVPPTVGDITSLTELRINNNAVVLIPAEIRHLTLLKVLDLSHNSIRALPPMIGMCNEVIGKLAHLEYIDVSNNFLKVLPFDMASLSNVKTLYIGGNPYTSPLLHGAIRPCIGSLTMKVVVGECMPNVNNKGKAGEKGSKHEPNALIEGMLYHTPAKAREAIVEETQRTTTKHATVEPVWRENLVFKLLDYSDSVTINLRHGMDMMPTDEQREAGEPVLGTLRVQTLATILIQDIFWSCHNLDSVGKMAEHAKAMYAKKDEIITAEGDRDGTYFFVLSGEVEMRQAGGESRKSVPVGKLELLHGTGGFSFLINSPQEHTLVALSDCTLITMKADAVFPPARSKSVQDERFEDVDEDETDERVNPECLSAALCSSEEGLCKQIILCEFNKRWPDDEGMHMQWGSQAWSKARLEEHKCLRNLVRKVQAVHAMTEQEFRRADQELERVNREQRDIGDSLLLAAIKEPITSMWLTFMEEELHDVKKDLRPRIMLRFIIKPNDVVDSILTAIAKTARGEDVVIEHVGNAEELLKRREALRPTPPGIDFEVETDPVMYDAEIERMRRFDRDIIDQRAKGRVKELWEAMPRFLSSSAASEKPWDTAFRGRDDYMSGEFWGMAALAEYVQSVPGAAEIKLKRRTNLNKGLLMEVGDQVEMSKPKNEWGDIVKTKAMLSKERTRRWEWIVGLLLLKSSYLNEREAKKDALSWQDRQLKALHDVQVEVQHKDRMAVLKREIATIEEEVHQCKLNVKDAVLSLRSGWHLEGVTKYKTNKARVEELKPKLAILLQSKMQQKTFYKLGMSVTKSMDWKKPPALTRLFEIFSEQADEILEPVDSLANILGGNIEPDLLDAIHRVEAVAPGTGMDHVAVCKWIFSDPVLQRAPLRRNKMVETISKHEVDGRTLFNCTKVDLQRMGLQGPSARLLLSRVFYLMKETGAVNKRKVTQVERISAEYASMTNEEAKDELLREKLLLGEDLLVELKVIFSQYDPNGNEEIPCKMIGKILADQGDDIHINELARLSKIADPDDSGACDLVGFCAAMRETSFVIGM